MPLEKKRRSLEKGSDPTVKEDELPPRNLVLLVRRVLCRRGYREPELFLAHNLRSNVAGALGSGLGGRDVGIGFGSAGSGSG